VTRPDQEALWVLRAQSDDRDAIELLLRSIQPSLRRYLLGLVGPDDADDLLQEVLLLIFRNISWLEDPDLFRPWAFRIANRAGVRHLKKRKRWAMEADKKILTSLAAPNDRLPDGALDALPQLQTISPASRAVLLLHFQEDLPLNDVAAILELPLGTVKSRLAYGLAALRREFRVELPKHLSDRSM
jgi:RNA polymerase sigma-70 factor (ECF subfamily)